MPATSEVQKIRMCIAYAYKRHGEGAIKSAENKADIIKLANSMSEDDLKDYCLSPVKK